jgi:hypothetical protein
MTDEKLEHLRKHYDVPPKLYASFDAWRKARVIHIKNQIIDLQKEMLKLTEGKIDGR